MKTSSMHTNSETSLQPEEIVSKYYQSFYSNGDLESVKNLMTEESYLMALEPFGMALAFKDPEFKIKWDQIKESREALNEVEKKISAELLSKNLSHQIDIKQVEANGSERKIVYYEENSKEKRLYFSKKDAQWRIDYFAGCPVSPVPESYFSSMKKWVLAKLPVFHKDLTIS